MSGCDQEPQVNSLSAKQETFVTALLSSPSIVAAARLAGISEKTGRRWLKLDHVRQAYQDAQKEVFDASLITLKLAVHDAVKTLTRHLNNEDTLPATQVRAAQIIVEQAIDLHKMSELEQKIAELEQLVKGRP